MSVSYHICEQWRLALESAGLGVFDAAFDYDNRQPLSAKSHSRTYGHRLDDGTLIFIKQDRWTGWRPIARAIIRGQKPLPAVGREREKMRRLAEMGFHTAEIIAYGERRRLGLPHQAVMITRCVPGVSLDRLQSDAASSPQFRQEAIYQARAVIRELQRTGCDWGRDCKPEHFFATREMRITLIDVERMKFRRRPLDEETCRRQFARFDSLLPQ